jgi:putative Ca2+/H+ antiporter (TMEM165/GDT1 family)
MHPFLVSISSVSLAEIGDKTQLLAMFLASRYQRPWPIIWGILLATLANHFLASVLGVWVRSLLSAGIINWVLAASFFAAGVWALFPDKLDEKDKALKSYGVFAATFVAFFLAEIGDKTQIVTTALAAQFNNITYVVIGTTLGMLVANIPAVFLGHSLAKRLPLHIVRYFAAGLFFIMSAAILLGVDFASLV